MKSELLSGNEAIARGAYEAGVSVASGYPGTPSTEILESLVQYKDELYCEWAPNEKVALEVAAGACLTGVRSMVTMKHVGLNVAADPLLTLSYIGVEGGMVVVVCDDPGMHSSQTEQDTRHYALLAKLPLLEPGNSRECLEFMKRAFEISEEYRTPVILRSTTCVSHSRFPVALGTRIAAAKAQFKTDPPRHVPIPVWGRKMRAAIEPRLESQAKAAAADKMNRVIAGSCPGETGIISAGAAALHCAELMPEYDLLKLGWVLPLPDELLKNFCAAHKRIVVVEEADAIIEERVKALGFKCDGKNIVPACGELTPEVLTRVKAAISGMPEPLTTPLPEAAGLPARPPVFCPGCPHRGLFYALGKFDVIVTGDIGCYSLGVFPPLSRTDVILCMGGGFTMAHGMSKAGESRPVVGIVGDSTFFHSGITGLINTVYNRSRAVLIVADNRTTAMTGCQDHPGTGKTLMGETAPQASIKEIARACGMKRIETVNPHDFAATHAALAAALAADEPSLIISRAPCLLAERKKVERTCAIDTGACRNCKACLKLGCPAIECAGNVKPVINPQLCTGCGLCVQVCRFGAISD